jgi:cell division protein FtsQ
MSAVHRGSAMYSARQWAPPLLVLLGLLLLAGTFYAWVLSQAGRVLTVQVEGRLRHMNPAEVAAAARPHLQTSFFRVDIRSVHDSVLALPWVERAQVRRRWPDGVVLQVWEKSAAARWGEKSLVTGDGAVFTPTKGTLPNGLPLLHGPADSERLLLESLSHFGDLLAPAGLKVAAIQIDDRGSWIVQMDSGLALRLGRGEIEERLRRFVDSTVPTLGDRLQQVAYVDLRYSSGFAVGWKVLPPEPQAAAEG